MAEEEMLKVADVHVLRNLVLAEGVSQCEVARRFGISRNTVTRYLDQRVVPGARVEGPRARPAQDVLRGPVVHILETAHVTRKQRLTAARVCELLAEQDIQDASVRTVRRLMAEYRRQKAEVFVPLDYLTCASCAPMLDYTGSNTINSCLNAASLTLRALLRAPEVRSQHRQREDVVQGRLQRGM
ncbi:MAG: helix-turn-helix domain-containing protein [Myxococcota bacterium]